MVSRDEKSQCLLERYKHELLPYGIYDISIGLHVRNESNYLAIVVVVKINEGH